MKGFTDFDTTNFLDNPQDYLKDLNPQDYKPVSGSSYNEGRVCKYVTYKDLNLLYLQEVILPRLEKEQQLKELNKTLEINAQNKKRAENRKSTLKIFIGVLAFIGIVCLIVL